MRIDCQVDFARVTGAAFTDGFGLIAGYASAVLMGLRIGAINEYPLKIGINQLGFEDFQPSPSYRPSVEALVDGIPTTKGAGQIPPRAASAHAVERAQRASANGACCKWRVAAESFPASAKARR
ncbi:hypothetical protein HNQ59_004014 [Chitinivorax tropicus]|uniref:Uncharacterized protein n=1 Tax=Chitinivorax tropicus TaxID=714531 RepID=A0A840MUD5_9PROT|nr:hypothetical protein [Chitinivorax tropicus]